ncbi:uncharacterized protein LOC120182386 [Hibiscus syriacus]|uniref:uncharacterized protein LOC120182386 n=1 Tax=Hibiscus syriacus TaxID=106335 RepID=UPI00192231B8|nr:uncharacterized protein LOC120182386 [Hibiscus syriacus]
MSGLDPELVEHKLPIKPECKPVQQKLRRMCPEMLLKIKEEVKKQFDVGFLKVAKYLEWVANIVPVPKKDGKVFKGSVVVDFIANRASEEYEPLDSDFLDENLMAITIEEAVSSNDEYWKMNFNGASNALGHGIGVILVSPGGEHYPLTNILNFDCTNNMTEGEWETKDTKLMEYRKLVLELIPEFEQVTFHYLPKEENQMADTLAILAAAFKVNEHSSLVPITMQAYEYPAHCYSIEEEDDGNPWYHDILQYIKCQSYPKHATENDRRTIRRLAA